MSKYHSRKTLCGGILFDSKKEAARYGVLRLMERAGEIQNLTLQPEFELIPKQKGERAVKYRADFMYEENGRTIVEDVKGMRTREYIIKRKLFRYIYGDKYEFREV